MRIINIFEIIISSVKLLNLFNSTNIDWFAID